MTASDLGLAASLVCSGAFYVVTGVVVINRRRPSPPSLPATSDLGPESPAVANLLVNGGRLTPDAVPATLLDLAARHLVKIEETEPGIYTCRLSTGPEQTLTPYEGQVLDLLRTRAVDGVVPAKALTAGPTDQARGWIKNFNRKVVEEADRAGICEPRWPPGVLALLGGLSLVAFLLAAFSGNEAEKLDVPQLIAIAVSLLTFVVMSRTFPDGTQVVTPLGLPSQARWLALRRYLHNDELFAGLPPTAVAVRDRYIAYGAALGAATAAVRAMPMGAESDRWAWTRYGGQWRQVRVSYPGSSWPPAWGYSPGQAAWLALRVGAIGLFWFWLSSKILPHVTFTAQQDQLGRLLSFGILLINLAALAASVCALWLLVAAVLGMVGATEVTGEAIRLRQLPGGSGVRCYLAVYRGTGDHVRAWVVSPEHYATLNEYEIVTVSVAALLGRVRSVRRAVDPAVGQSNAAPGAARP
ncbi:MAG: DUF2207 domain-containing protein [Candidatus Dormibacteraeota bacterium]|nr:DUF2207 domain-containing protein [Candidatus Dormibacteraeota bacterium]